MSLNVFRTNLSKEQEEQAQNSLQAGFAYIQALTKLERRPGSLRGNTADRAEHRSSTARPRTMSKRPLQKVSKLEIPKRETSTAQLRKDGTLTQSVAKVCHEGRTRTDCGGCGRVATRQTPIQHTNAKKQEEKLFGVAGGSQTSTSQDAPQMLNRAKNTFWPLT